MSGADGSNGSYGNLGGAAGEMPPMYRPPAPPQRTSEPIPFRPRVEEPSVAEPVAQRVVETPAPQPVLGRDPEHLLGVCRHHDGGHRGRVQGQEDAVRLDRTRHVDRLPVARGEVARLVGRRVRRSDAQPRSFPPQHRATGFGRMR